MDDAGPYLHLQEQRAQLSVLVGHLEVGDERRRLQVLVDVVVDLGGEIRGALPREDEPRARAAQILLATS